MRKSAPDRSSLSRTSLSSSTASPAVLQALKRIDSASGDAYPAPDRSAITRLSQSPAASSSAIQSALKRVDSSMKTHNPVLNALEMYDVNDDTARAYYNSTTTGDNTNNASPVNPPMPISQKAPITSYDRTTSSNTLTTPANKTRINYEVRAITSMTGNTAAGSGSGAMKAKPVVVVSERGLSNERPTKGAISPPFFPLFPFPPFPLFPPFPPLFFDHNQWSEPHPESVL